MDKEKATEQKPADNGAKPADGTKDHMSSADYYFNSYSHFGMW